jgi:multidrug resistance efflux pump
MIELILGTYGALCWLLFKKFRIIPVNTYTVFTAIGIGVVILGSLTLLLMMFHPASNNARTLALTTPIVSQVRGLVVDVPVTPNQPLKKGDALFIVDPAPYLREVERLEAVLANAQTTAAQIEERLRAAEATTKQARAELLASKSELGKQARDALDQAGAAVDLVVSELDLARKDEQRYRSLAEKGYAPRQQYEQMQQRVASLEAQLRQAKSTERQATEKLGSGGDRIRSVQERLRVAESREREARLAFDARSGGVNPEVRRITTELEQKRWELENTVTRAPADGFVTQVILRPGQMAVPLPLAPVMVFVHAEDAVLGASFPQNVIAGIKPGLEAELAFKSYPGRIFKAKVLQVLPAVAEGQLRAGGQLQSLPSDRAPGRIPVVFSYGEDVASLRLPAGSQATVAVYTERMHALQIARKILLRIKSWENYIFMP